MNSRERLELSSHISLPYHIHPIIFFLVNPIKPWIKTNTRCSHLKNTFAVFPKHDVFHIAYKQTYIIKRGLLLEISNHQRPVAMTLYIILVLPHHPFCGLRSTKRGDEITVVPRSCGNRGKTYQSKDQLPMCQVSGVSLFDVILESSLMPAKYN